MLTASRHEGGIHGAGGRGEACCLRCPRRAGLRRHERSLSAALRTGCGQARQCRLSHREVLREQGASSSRSPARRRSTTEGLTKPRFQFRRDRFDYRFPGRHRLFGAPTLSRSNATDRPAAREKVMTARGMRAIQEDLLEGATVPRPRPTKSTQENGSWSSPTLPNAVASRFVIEWLKNLSHVNLRGQTRQAATERACCTDEVATAEVTKASASLRQVTTSWPSSPRPRGHDDLAFQRSRARPRQKRRIAPRLLTGINKSRSYTRDESSPAPHSMRSVLKIC